MSNPSHTVLVTGVTHGIGRAICERLHADGYSVVGMDARPCRHPDLTAFEQVDMRDIDATRCAVERIAKRFEISRLVNNVGTSVRELVQEGTGATEVPLLNLNVAAAITCTQAVLPTMRRLRDGRIVNITSRAAFGRETRSIYSATKSAMMALTRSWAIELAAHGISVNAVSPGMIDTELFRRNNPPAAADVSQLYELIPLKRLGTAAEVAHAVAFLLDERSTYINGQTIQVCGGLSVAKKMA